MARWRIYLPVWQDWQASLRQAGVLGIIEVGMFLVYALKSVERNYIYVGMTGDLAERIRRHNSGRERTTRPYRPFTLIYQKTFLDRQSARGHEKYLKSGAGKEYLKTLL